MIPFLATFILAFIVYLVLTAGSGEVGLWAPSELVMGAVLSLLVAAISRNFLCMSRNFRMANPLRLLLLVVYLVPFFIEMAAANLDVAYRVITGRIRPGIVRLQPGLKTDLGATMLANSITLTPGTLTVEIDDETNDLYVHMINVAPDVAEKAVADTKDIFTFFRLPDWIRRIAE